MLIFELLNQFGAACRAGFFRLSTKVNKTFRNNIIEILLLNMVIPERINFLQYGRYGRRTEAIYRRTFGRDFDWMGFNMNLAADRFQHGMKRLAIAIDASYIRKAGKKTAHVGRFWSGCASAVKHGLEVLAIGLVDVDINDCMMLRAVQTLNSTELKARNMTLPQWYLYVLKKYSAELHKITDVVVADAGFSGKPFVDGLKELGFNLVSRLRSDAILFYSCQAERTGKRGRPRKHGVQIDFDNLDMDKVERVWSDKITGKAYAYQLVAYSKSLGRSIRLVIYYDGEGGHKIFFCTDTEMIGKDVYETYTTRFQIEFCFRDGHQFTGLMDCQARGEKKLDFAFNASLATVNVVKTMLKNSNLDLSIGQLKSLMSKAYFAQRIFDRFGIDPNTALNAKLVNELFGYVAKTA